MRLTASFTNDEYQAIRHAAMTGRLTADFTRSGPEVIFRTKNPKLLCKQLGQIVDFGATSPNEVFGLGE